MNNHQPQHTEDKKILSVPRNVFYTGLVSFFMDMSSEMIYPLVPLFLSSVLGVNRTVIGIIEGVAESTASLLKVFSGWFSDRIRKRKIIHRDFTRWGNNLIDGKDRGSFTRFSDGHH